MTVASSFCAHLPRKSLMSCISRETLQSCGYEFCQAHVTEFLVLTIQSFGNPIRIEQQRRRHPLAGHISKDGADLLCCLLQRHQHIDAALLKYWGRWGKARRAGSATSYSVIRFGRRLLDAKSNAGCMALEGARI